MMDEAQYMKDRIEDQVAWYGARSRMNKIWFQRLRATSIFVSLCIPILTSLIGEKNNDTIKIVIAVAGATVAFIEGLMSLKKYQDLWTTYRVTGESLKYHRYLFETGSAPYDVPNAFKLFVQNAEGLMAAEHTNWMQLSMQKSNPPQTDRQADDQQNAQPAKSTEPANVQPNIPPASQLPAQPDTPPAGQANEEPADDQQ